MKPPVVEYRRARSVEHAVDLLAELGDEAKLLAGGQSLIPMLNLRLARPSVLIDIGRLALDRVARTDGQVRLGALLRHRQVEHDPRIGQLSPLLARCARYIGFPAIRSRGTLGGSLAHADATAELCLATVTLGAEFVLTSRDRGPRTVEATEFFEGPFMTTIEPDEMLTEVLVPAAPPGQSVHFREVTEQAGEFAAAAIAAVFTEQDGRMIDVRVGVAGLESRPSRLSAVEAALEGQETVRVDRLALLDAVDTDAVALGVPAEQKRYELALVRALVRDFLDRTSPTAPEAGTNGSRIR